MCLVEDQRAVEQFVAAALDPPLDDRVHAGHLYGAADDGDAGVGEDGVEQRWVFAVAVPDEETCPAVGVLQVHGEVADRLGDPGGGRVRGRAHDPYASGGVLDDGEDVHSRAGEGYGVEKVGGGDGLGLGT